MPANPENPNTEGWHPQPDFQSPYGELGRDCVSYTPAGLQECAQFIIDCQMPDIAAYGDFPTVQAGLAYDRAAEVYRPGRDVMPPLQKMLEAMAREEHQLQANRRAETYTVILPTEEPTRTVYVASVQRLGESRTYHTAGMRRSRVSA